MQLNERQVAMLAGKEGQAKQWAMLVLIEVGERHRAERLVSIRSAHLADWSGPDSDVPWEFLATFRDAKFEVPFTINPCLSDNGARLDTLRSWGMFPSETCVPFLVGNRVNKGDHLAWSGRMAVAFANSVVDACTNMEEPRTVLAAGLTGLIPEHGLHLKKNRRPTVVIHLPKGTEAESGQLGHVLSGIAENEVPVIIGLHLDLANARRLMFNLNSRGTVPLAYLRRDTNIPAGIDTIDIDRTVIQPPRGREDIDLILLGCPHLSEQEINHWANLIGDGTPRREIWSFTAPLCMDKCPKSSKVLERNGRMISGKCPLALVGELRGRKIGCDSPTMTDCLRQHRLDVTYLTFDAIREIIQR